MFFAVICRSLSNLFYVSVNVSVPPVGFKLLLTVSLHGVLIQRRFIVSKKTFSAKTASEGTAASCGIH